jgi:hypothetical protein
MMTTSNRPSAVTDASADHRPKVAPETEPSCDERVKRPPSTAELRPALPPEVQGLVEPPGAAIRADMWQDERIKRPPPQHMLPPVIPPDIRALLGEPPLLPGEDRAAYEALLTAVAQARAPKDIVEWLNVKDIADDAWEAERLKRLKTRLLTRRVEAELCRHLADALEKKIKDQQARRLYAQRLSSGWTRNDLKAVKEVLRLLPDGVDLSLVTAWALATGHETFEILDQMLTTALKRRQKAAQDIETRRLAFARCFRLEHVFPARCRIM